MATKNLNIKFKRKKLIQQLCADQFTDYSLEVGMRITENRYEGLKAPDPNSYDTASQYLEDVQAYAFVAKNDLFKLKGLKPSDMAVEAFFDAEIACRKTNFTFKNRLFTFRERSLLERARHYCHSILGSFSDIIPDFGPGSTVTLHGRFCNIITKMGVLPESTPKSYEYVVRNILHYMPAYCLSNGMVIRDGNSLRLGAKLATLASGSTFLTVPKNWKTDRPICVEPSGQMLIQKGIGNLIARRLKEYGYDLPSLPPIHGAYAQRGSIDGDFATIDLASASDTVAYEFVKFMVPEEWFTHLEAVRSTHVNIGPTRLELQKFSSMGNGYTFELETVLFLSLMLATREGITFNRAHVSVFGDDIICPTEMATAAMKNLELCGFSINREKSFISGPFRESCGNDYFRGIPVRPVYFKKTDLHPLEDVYKHLNQIRLMAERLSFVDGLLDNRFKDTWDSLLRLVPHDYRNGGPEHLGDAVIHGYKETRQKRKQKRIRVLKRASRTFNRTNSSFHLLACALYGVPEAGVLTRSSKFSLVNTWIRQPKTLGGKLWC